MYLYMILHRKLAQYHPLVSSRLSLGNNHYAGCFRAQRVSVFKTLSLVALSPPRLKLAHVSTPTETR